MVFVRKGKKVFAIQIAQLPSVEMVFAEMMKIETPAQVIVTAVEMAYVTLMKTLTSALSTVFPQQGQLSAEI